MTRSVTKNARPSFHFSGGSGNETSELKVETRIKFLNIMYHTPSQVIYLSQWLSVAVFVLCPGEILCYVTDHYRV